MANGTRNRGPGSRRRSSNEEGPTRSDGNSKKTLEDEWNHPFSTPSSVSGRGRGRGRGRESAAQPTAQSREGNGHEPCANAELTTSREHTASQERGGSGETGHSSQREGRRGDTMEGEGGLEEGFDGEGGGGGGEDDPLDALFGDENMMDVAEAGEEGGWEGVGCRWEMGGNGERENSSSRLRAQPATISDHPQQSFAGMYIHTP